MIRFVTTSLRAFVAFAGFYVILAYFSKGQIRIEHWHIALIGCAAVYYAANEKGGKNGRR